MPIKIISKDITKINCDAMVETDTHDFYGKVVITPVFSLPNKYVIHTIEPHWNGGKNGEESLLRLCYRDILKLAFENKCKSITIPLISSGIFGFPKDKVLKIAVDEISAFLFENEMLVYIVVLDKKSYSISEKLFSDITAFIEETYEDERILFKAVRMQMCECVQCDTETLNDMLKNIDESFSQMLLRKIDEKRMTDAECYKKANIDRKLFSKIRNDVNYKPSKPTVIAFAISLELTLEETEDMLRKAGFALSHSNKFDIIIEYFISHGNYNIFEINETLFAFDQRTLGA